MYVPVRIKNIPKLNNTHSVTHRSPGNQTYSITWWPWWRSTLTTSKYSSTKEPISSLKRRKKQVREPSSSYFDTLHPFFYHLCSFIDHWPFVFILKTYFTIQVRSQVFLTIRVHSLTLLDHYFSFHDSYWSFLFVLEHFFTIRDCFSSLLDH